MSDSQPDVVVIGAGIAGLGAARTLAAGGADVVVLEAEAHVGGRMRSVQWHDRWVDLGGEEITDTDRVFLDVAAAHDLDVIRHAAGAGGYGVYRDGEIHGFEISRPLSMLTFSGIGLPARLGLLKLLPTLARQAVASRGAALDESWRAWKLDDTSLEDWLGRLNPEFLEYAIEPLFDIFFGWQPAEISRGWFAFTMTAYADVDGFTLKQGIGAITRAMAAELDVRTSTRVQTVDVTARVVEADGPDGPVQLRPDAILVAVPGTAVSAMTVNLDHRRQAFFDRVRYAPQNLHYFWLSDVPDALPEMCFYPRRESSVLSSISRGLPTDRQAPVLRLGLKSSAVRDLAAADDDAVAATALAEADERVPGVSALVTDRLLSRWRHGLPMFDVGSLHRLRDFHALPPLPGVAFAGDYLGNAATGAAYLSGQRAARQLADHLSS